MSDPSASVNTEEKKASELSPLEKKVLRQVEFYFSDSNLPKDKFLMNLLPTDNGWIPIATIASFKRMRSLTTDLEAVVAALRKSPSLLAVSEDGQKVKRIPPLPENVNERILKHSVYAKGFPTDATIESVTEFFAPYGDVKCVRLRKGTKKKPGQKDSVFVEFSSEEEAKKIAAQEIKAPNSDALLKLMLKTDYLAKKKAEFEERTGKKAKEPKQKQPKQQKQEKKQNKRKTFDDAGEAKDQENGEKKQKTEGAEEGKEEEKKDEPFFFKKDLLIKVSDLKEESTREHIRDFFQAIGAHVGYVDFSRGQTTGTLQLAEDDPNGAVANAAKAKESEIELGGKKGKEITFTAITGEEEEAYWKGVAEKKKQFKANRGGKKGGRGRGGKGGGRGGRGGKGKKRKNEAQ